MTTPITSFAPITTGSAGRTGNYIQDNSDFSRPVYALLNASVGADVGNYEISVYGKNLLDSTKIIQHISINELISAYSPQPPTFGIKLTAKF